MKKIFFAIIALAALVGCNTEVMEEVATTPQYLTTSFEVDLNGESRAFDSELKWSWESTDEIAAFQFAGEQTVNKLTLKDNGKFGTDEFKYATNDPADFKFVYPAAALNADKSLGYVQTGEWTPTLVGIVENTTVNNIGTVEMKHMSAAFEIRVWDEGRQARKTISAATITSESDFCDGKTATVEGLNTDTVVFNIAEGDFAFNLTLTATDDKTYTVAVPTKNFVNGQRTILNVEWNNLALEGVNSWYNEVSNGVDSKLEAGAIYLNGLSGKDAVVYVDGNPATVSDNVIYDVASGEHTVYAAYKSNKTAEYKVVVTGKPSISYTATTSYHNNAGTVLKSNTLTNGNEGKLLTITNYSCNIAAEDAPYFGTPVFVYGNNETAPANKSIELAVGQYNTYVKLPIGTSGYSLKYGQATMIVTGIPYSYKFYQSSDAAVDAAGWTRNGKASTKEDLMTLKEGGLAGSDSGWVASPAYYAPNGGLSSKVTLEAKYYVAAISPSGKNAVLYVGATSSPTSSSSTSSSLTLNGSNSTSSNKAWSTVSTSVNIPTGTQYVSINHNGATYRTGSRIYLCSYKIEYK